MLQTLKSLILRAPTITSASPFIDLVPPTVNLGGDLGGGFEVDEENAFRPIRTEDRNMLRIMRSFTCCDALTLPSGATLKEPEEGMVWRSDGISIRQEPIVRKYSTAD